jgi:hypothetical protein
MFVGESGCPALGPGGEVAGEWCGAGLCGLFDDMHAGGCTCNLVCRVGAGQGFIWGTTGAPLGLPAGMATVQQKSTATGADAGGLAATREDGDLHRWTRVDVLPPDGMQEVSGSSPLSSTQVRHITRTLNR